MPLKDRYASAKNSWRRRFGWDPQNTNSPSTLNGQNWHPNPSSVPPKRPQANDGTTPVSSSFQSPPIGLSAYSLAPDIAAAPPASKPTETGSNSLLGVSHPDAAASTVAPNPAATGSQETPGWTGLKTLLTVLNASSGVFPPLKSAVGGLNSCVEIFENASRGRKDYLELLAKLDSLLGDLSGYIGHITGPKMTASMMNLCIGLDQELQIVQDKNARGVVRQHMEALEDTNEILASYRRIQGYLERLAMNANLSMWETVSNLETESRLKALMPALSAVYNSAESEVLQRRQCTPGTRENELVKLLSWAHHQASKTEDVYWMNGMAGTGKTTIAYSLCVELDKTAELGASFFCSRQIPECRNVKLIIPSIAYQLARFSRPFRYALSAILEADPDVHTRVLKAQFDNLLAKPLGEVKDALPTDLIVVIDALDECENEDSVGQILDVLFSRSNETDLPVRFLISSRPETEIYGRMMSRVGDGVDARLVLHDLDTQAVQHDIETYLLAELASVDLSPSQLASLVELSGVLFIFASTAARYIKEGQQYMEHEDRLDTILGLALEPTDSKDKEIDKLYTSILRAAFQTDRISKSVQTRLKMILDTIICAQEPMNLDGLAGLLGLRSGKQVGALLGSLSSVLNISESKGLVTTLHASFSDYILDHERSASFYCDSTTTHSRLSRQSFDILRNLRPQFNICGLESSYLRDEEVPDLTERSNQVVLFQVFYACRYWIAHLELAGGSEPNEMKDLLGDLLSKRLLLWMEVLNLKKSMGLGPDILQRAKIWSKTNNCPQKTVDLAHDAWRFVAMFASHAVSQSTPHIYVSMLPFWPEAAPVSKTYFTQPLGALQLRGTALTRRRLELLATWDFKGWPESISLSSDGTRVAIGCLSSAYVVDSTTREAILGPLLHDDWIRSVAWSTDAKFLATGSNDQTVRVWQTENGKLVRGPLTGHSGKVTSVCFLPNGTHVVSASEDKTLRIWDLTNEVVTIRIIEAHDDHVLSMHVSPDGARIASGSRDKSIRIWDAESGKMTCPPLTGHAGPVKSVRFSPDGARIASGSHDKTVRVWSNLGANTTARELRGHTDEVYCVAFSSDGKRIVSGGHDHTIHIWEAGACQDPVHTLRGHMNDIYSVAFSPDGTRLFSSSIDWTVRVWDLWSQGLFEGPLGGHGKAVLSVSFSNDGNRILSCSIDTTICVWDAQNGQLVLGPLRDHSHFVHTACFSPNNTQIVSASEGRTIRLWDAESGLPIGKPLTGHTGGVLSACFSPDGTLIASGSKDMTIRLWNARSQDPISEPLREHTDWVRPVYFLPDGSKIVSGAADRTILIWDVKSGERLLSPLLGHTGPVMTVAASPDGTRFASGATDKTVRLWDAQTGQALPPPLQGHTARVKFLTFSPDSRYIVSGSDDATVRIWDAKTGQAIGRPTVGHTMGIHCCAFSPDCKRIVTSSQDRSIRVLDVADYTGTPRPQETESSSLPEGAASALAPSFTLQEEGWVVDAQSRLLAWVPPDLRPALLHAGNMLLISTGGSFELGFESAMLGKSWTEPYRR